MIIRRYHAVTSQLIYTKCTLTELSALLDKFGKKDDIWAEMRIEPEYDHDYGCYTGLYSVSFTIGCDCISNPDHVLDEIKTADSEFDYIERKLK